MLPIFTSKEMAALDKVAIEEFGIPGAVLMETAARGVYRTALELLNDYYGPAVPLPASFGGGHDCGDEDCHHSAPQLPARMIAHDRFVKIFCGKGNNGGDGMAVARMLDSAGAEVEVILLCKGDDLEGDARLQYDLCRNLEMEIVEDASDEDFFIEEECHLVIDALLGTGIQGPAKGKVAEAIEAINEASCPVVSIDIPSGVEGSTGKVLGPAVTASATPTMAALKRGLIFSPGREYAGEVALVDIGTPFALIEASNPYLWQVEPDDVMNRLPERNRDTHKGECGRVFILAGSTGFTGAAAMVSEACIKSGAGLVVLGIPQSLNTIMEIKLTETMTVSLPETAEGSYSAGALPEIQNRLKWATACALGPGISRNKETIELILNVIKELKIPTVIDADALFALAEARDISSVLPENCILTPHMGEFARLLGMNADEVKDNRVELVQKYSQEWGTVIVLKGSPTLIGCPDGQIFVNPTGNPGMATGGVGDVLTGHLAALLGMGTEPEEAAIAGVYLHGLAGDMAMADKGEFGMTASDIIAKLPEVLKEFGR